MDSPGWEAFSRWPPKYYNLDNLDITCIRLKEMCYDIQQLEI